MKYSVKGNWGNTITSEKYKLSLYFNSSKRAEKFCDVQHAVNEQAMALDEIIASGKPVSDEEDTRKRFNLLNISFEKDGRVKSFETNQEKVDNMLLTAEFFASKALGVDLDPLQAMNNYAE